MRGGIVYEFAKSDFMIQDIKKRKKKFSPKTEHDCPSGRSTNGRARKNPLPWGCSQEWIACDWNKQTASNGWLALPTYYTDSQMKHRLWKIGLFHNNWHIFHVPMVNSFCNVLHPAHFQVHLSRFFAQFISVHKLQKSCTVSLLKKVSSVNQF